MSDHLWSAIFSVIVYSNLRWFGVLHGKMIIQEIASTCSSLIWSYVFYSTGITFMLWFVIKVWLYRVLLMFQEFDLEFATQLSINPCSDDVSK